MNMNTVLIAIGLILALVMILTYLTNDKTPKA
jgi:hypothetical protein